MVARKPKALALFVIGAVGLATAVPASAATPTTVRVSVGAASAQANKASGAQLVAAGGRIVVFQSGAANLIPRDTNGVADVFLRNTAAGTTVRVSVSGTERQANAKSEPVAVSDDGRFVLFNSYATNIGPGDTNHTSDVFLRDRQRGSTIRMKRSDGLQFSRGADGMDVSDDGRYVTLVTSRNFDLYLRLRDRVRHTSLLLAKDNYRHGPFAGAQLSSAPLIASSAPSGIVVFDATGHVRSSVTWRTASPSTTRR